MMEWPLLSRIVNGLLWRVAWRTETLFVRAGPLAIDPPNPLGFELVRLGRERTRGLEIAETAMVRAGEQPELVRQRIEHGDDFFGWESNGSVACFLWVTYRNRVTSGVRMLEADNRAFLFNGYTLPEFRGQGLYPQLFLHVRRHLMLEQRTEVVGEVNVRNTSSRRGIEKAGLKEVGRCSSITFFRRWEFALSKEMLDDSVPRLF